MFPAESGAKPVCIPVIFGTLHGASTQLLVAD